MRALQWATCATACLLVVLGAATWGCSVSALAAPPPDDPLLRDLAPKKGAADPKPNDPKRTKAGDRSQPGGTGDGAARSVGTAPSVAAWKELEELTHTVARRLEAGDTGAETQRLQSRIVTLLDALATAQREASSARRDVGSRRPTGPSSATKASDQPQGAATGPLESSDRSPGASKQARDPQQVVERIWGHLPSRVRDRLRAIGGVRFLPRYEKQIEAYYRRLGE